MPKFHLTRVFEISVVCLVCILLLFLGIGIVKIFQTEDVNLDTIGDEIELEITTNLGPDLGSVQIKPLLNLSEYNAKIIGDLEVDKLTLKKLITFLSDGMAEDIAVNFKAKRIILAPKEIDPNKTALTK